MWDTVAQFGLNGLNNTDWELAIPPEAKNVFQAVALNEHRYAFPVESINRGIQRGFIGSHADIGGSYGSGDLSDIALNWMVQQAEHSGVKMHEWKEISHKEWGVITNPLLHDKVNSKLYGTIMDTSAGEDRSVCSRTNRGRAQNCQDQKEAVVGGMTWSQTARYIQPYGSPGLIDFDGVSRIVGKIKIKEYEEWLKKNYHMTFTQP